MLSSPVCLVHLIYHSFAFTSDPAALPLLKLLKYIAYLCYKFFALLFPFSKMFFPPSLSSYLVLLCYLGLSQLLKEAFNDHSFSVPGT